MFHLDVDTGVGSIWVHERSDMDVHEQSAMDLDSQAVSDRVTKQIITIFSKT